LFVRIFVLVFGAFVIAGCILFLILEAMDKVESIQKRAPWIEKVLRRREAFVALLLIAVVLLLGDGYESWTKEIPEVPEVHLSGTFPAPPAPNITITRNTHPAKGEQAVPLLPLRCRAEGLSREIYAFNSEWEGAQCGMIICGQHPDVEHQTQVINNEAKIEGKQFRQQFLAKGELLAQELRKKGKDTTLLDARLQSIASGTVNSGLNELIASEVLALANQLPQVDCGAINSRLLE
jgi:hypothetical protein